MLESVILRFQNCANLDELSLLGCKLLNSDSQKIISHGCPGLISIHLEECGEVTVNGVSSLLNCTAIEDLLLRHDVNLLLLLFFLHLGYRVLGYLKPSVFMLLQSYQCFERYL